MESVFLSRFVIFTSATVVGRFLELFHFQHHATILTEHMVHLLILELTRIAANMLVIT